MSKKSKQPTKSDKPEKEKSAVKLISDNRRARFEYEILEVIEAGIELVGTEVKAMRQGRANLQDAFARIDNDEAWLYNCHVSLYEHGNRFNHEPTRKRKLLLNRKEIQRLKSKMQEKGLSLIPLKLFFKRNWIKLDLALSRGKRLYDKRDSISKRESDRQLARVVKNGR